MNIDLQFRNVEQSSFFWHKQRNGLFDGGFNNRYEKLKELFNKHFKNNKFIKLCEHKLIKKEEQIESELHDYINLGFEGLMVNTYDGEYLQKRSKEYLTLFSCDFNRIIKN